MTDRSELIEFLADCGVQERTCCCGAGPLGISAADLAEGLCDRFPELGGGDGVGDD